MACETLKAQPPMDIFCPRTFTSPPVVGSLSNLIITSATVEPITKTFFICIPQYLFFLNYNIHCHILQFNYINKTFYPSETFL